jgi:signal transduction histidine kinase
MSIRLRLTLLHTLLLGVVLTAFAIIVYAAISAQEVSQLNYELRARTDDLQERALGVRVRAARGRAGELPALAGNAADLIQREDAPADVAPDVVLPNDSLNSAMTERMAGSPFSAQLLLDSGEVIAHTADPRPVAPIPAGLWTQVMANGQHTARAELDGQPYQVLGTQVETGRFSNRLLLVVMSPLAPIEATLAAWRLTLALIVAGTIAISAAIAWFMASRALRPVDRMTTAARAIGQATDFSRRIPEPEQGDELGRLARTFNEMLDRLAAAYATQRRFLADASHELRTPLTVIGTNTAALLRGGDHDPVEREETLRATARETDRMTRLVSDLLTLARVDAGLRPAFRRLAFDAVVLEVYQQQQSLTGDVRLLLGEWEQAEVEADPDRLKQVVLNLVDNAIRYTPPGGTVTLELHRAGRDAVLRVRDTGIGIPLEHQERVFERFYRVDQPRSRYTGGTGLGLAIAREVAIAHGGRLELVSQAGAGSTFTLTLPCQRPTPTSNPTPTRPPSALAQTPDRMAMPAD